MARRLSLTSDPNVLPMIDVLLVLLVIFMLAFMKDNIRRWLDVQLPLPAASVGGAIPMVLTVGVGPMYSLNGRVLPPGNLEEALRSLVESRRERIVHVRADARLKYYEVMRVFDAIRGAGVTVTSVITSESPTRRR